MRRNKQFNSVLAGLFLSLIGLNVAHAQCTLPYTLTNGQPPDATKVMANFNALISCLNPGGSANAVQYNAGSGSLGGVGPLTNGQVLIGSTGNPPQAQTLTAGSGMTISSGAGNITVGAAGGMPSTGLYRQVTSATPSSASTGLSNWLNQGTSVLSEGAAGLSISAPPSGSNSNIVGRFMPAPTPPYKIKALIAATRNSYNYSGVGIGWYDGSAKLHLLSYSIANGGTPFLEVTAWSGVTVYQFSNFTSSFNGYAQPRWLQLQDDGTNVSFAFSQDGANFLTLFSVAKSSGYLGASGYSQVLFFVNPRGLSNTIGTVMSWQQG
jgi:hypothetical protein